MPLIFYYKCFNLSVLAYTTINYFIRLYSSSFSTTKNVMKCTGPKYKDSHNNKWHNTRHNRYKLKIKKNVKDSKYYDPKSRTLKIKYKDWDLEKTPAYTFYRAKFLTTFFTSKSKFNLHNLSISWVSKVSSLLSNGSFNFKAYIDVVKYHSGCRPVKSIYKKALRRFLRNTWLSGYSRGKNSYLSKLSLTHNPLLKYDARALLYNKRSNKPSRPLWKYKKLERSLKKRKVRRLRSSNLNNLIKGTKSFKNKYFRTKNARRSLFSKKIFRTIKLARSTFRLVSQLRSKGRNRLIKSVRSFNHSTFYNRLLNFEMSAISLLLKTSFLWSFNDARYIIKSGYFYINGKLVRNPKEVVIEGSRLQLPVSKVTYRWLSDKKKALYKGYKKANRLRWYKKRVRYSRFRKKSYKYPKWLFKYAMVGSKAPALLEVDYTTLTAIILYRPTRFNELNSPLWYYINLHAYNIYLWKLIN